MATIEEKILGTCLEMGASLAGIAEVEAVKNSPSHSVFKRLEAYTGVGSKPPPPSWSGDIRWPPEAKSVLVIALEHPADEPHLDWWGREVRGGTEGNRRLISICTAVSKSLKEQMGISARNLPYHIEDGGIFLKDAAVLAGIGVLGANNMVVSPSLGPRVRLRAMFLDKRLSSSGPIAFDPCLNCNRACHTVCPVNAFTRCEAGKDSRGQPGPTGGYDRRLCNRRMEQDRQKASAAAVRGAEVPHLLVRYCRACEFACPIGK